MSTGISRGQQKSSPTPPATATDDKVAKKEGTDKALAEAPKSPGAPVDPSTFKLGSEDIIYVSVWHDADFSRGYLIRPDGKISVPFVGELQAAGLTPVELGKIMTEKLTAIIKDPQVDVSVTQVNSRKYYIQGGVGKTGSWPLTVPTTVMEALTNAGGFKDFSRPDKIVIMRKGERIKFNYKEVVKGKKTEQNILLEPGDLIIVPE